MKVSQKDGLNNKRKWMGKEQAVSPGLTMEVSKIYSSSNFALRASLDKKPDKFLTGHGYGG